MSGAAGTCGPGAVAHGGQTLVEVEAMPANPTCRGAVARGGVVPRFADAGAGALDLAKLRPMWVAPECIVLPFKKRTHLLQNVATTLDPSFISNPSGMMWGVENSAILALQRLFMRIESSLVKPLLCLGAPAPPGVESVLELPELERPGQSLR